MTKAQKKLGGQKCLKAAMDKERSESSYGQRKVGKQLWTKKGLKAAMDKKMSEGVGDKERSERSYEQ